MNFNMIKLKRNERCWCGSGKKYKKCHLDIDQNPTPEGLNKSTKNLYNKQKNCLHPEANYKKCRGNIIKAHTISKRSALSKIAKNNHVYGYSFKKNNFFDLLKNKGQFSAQLIGVNDASTFSGFCEYHDKIFEPIDKSAFQINEYCCFLLGYRAICRELFGKRFQLHSIDILEHSSHMNNNELKNLIEIYKKGVEVGLNDIIKTKTIFDKILLNKRYSNIKYYAIIFTNLPDILCSGAIIPDYDFAGNKLQDLSDLSKELAFITLSIVPFRKGGAVIFSWVGTNHNSSKELILSLEKLKKEDIQHAIIRFAFTYLENVFWSPNWWDSLSDKQKKEINRRRMLNIGMNIVGEDCLIADGYKLVNWNLDEIKTNI